MSADDDLPELDVELPDPRLGWVLTLVVIVLAMVGLALVVGAVVRALG